MIAHLDEAAHEIIAVMLNQRKHECLVHERGVAVAIQRKGLKRVEERRECGEFDGAR